MVAQTYNLALGRLREEGFEFEAHPGLHSETLSQTKQIKKKKKLPLPKSTCSCQKQNKIQSLIYSSSGFHGIIFSILKTSNTCALRENVFAFLT
jgi:hypothetical protein